MRHDDTVLPAVKKQRRAVDVMEMLDFADEYQMIAAVVADGVAAFERGQAIFQNWRAAAAFGPIDSGKFIIRRSRELIGQIALVSCQHIHGKMRARFEGG